MLSFLIKNNTYVFRNEFGVETISNVTAGLHSSGDHMQAVKRVLLWCSFLVIIKFNNVLCFSQVCQLQQRRICRVFIVSSYAILFYILPK